MRKRGFSFLEVLVALAILTVLSVSLAPLVTGLAATDRTLRVRLRAWDAARSHLTALYLADPRAEAGGGAFDVRWETVPAPAAKGGGGAWSRLSVVPKNETKAALELALRTGAPAR
jgi:prepilin-type N-terminal cleavage/methylation domain-containing protein